MEAGIAVRAGRIPEMIKILEESIQESRSTEDECKIFLGNINEVFVK